MIEILTAICVINFTKLPVRVITMETLPLEMGNKSYSDTWLVKTASGKEVRVFGDRCVATKIKEVK